MKSKGKNKLPFVDFANRFIKAYHTEKSKGIHTVFDGFNEAARLYYGKDFDVVKATNDAIDAGKLEGYLTKGGMRLYRLGEMPQSRKVTPEDRLKGLDLSF